MELVIGNSLLFVFVIIEICILHYFRKESIPWREIITNINSGHILLWIFRGLEVAAYFTTYKYLSFGWVSSLPFWAVWLLAFVLWDFCFYWLHRLHHYFKVFWGVHSVHHEGEHFSLSLGIRNSWYSSITSFPFFIILALIGIPVDIFVAVSSIHYFIQFYNHTHLINKSGWLEYLIVTPSHHRVHHGKNKPYLHKNFSGTFIVWDKLFHTFQEELDHNPVIFGIDGVPKTNNPIIINNSPFIRLYTKIKSSSTSKLTRSFSVSNLNLISGAILLFALLLFYIYFETQFSDQRSLLFFTMIFIGTIGNGLLSDSNKMGIWIWSISTLVFSIFFLTFFTPYVLLFNLTLIIYFLHGLLTLVFMVKSAVKP